MLVQYTLACTYLPICIYLNVLFCIHTERTFKPSLAIVPQFNSERLYVRIVHHTGHTIDNSTLVILIFCFDLRNRWKILF